MINWNIKLFVDLGSPIENVMKSMVLTEGDNWPFEGELSDFIHNSVMQTNVKL